MSKPKLLARDVPTGVRLLLGLLAMVAIGTTVLSLPVSSTRDLSFMEAMFTAVSALTVTGLSTITPVLDLTRFGKICLMLLIQMGGVGYMVLAILVFRLLGRSISMTDRFALQDALGLLNVSGIVQLVIRVFFTVLAIETVGAVLLFWHWSNNGVLVGQPPGYIAFYAMFHAVSGFCNAGFDLFAGRYEFPTDAGTLGILGTLVVLGGLGIPVLYDFFTYWNRRVLSLHTKLTCIATFSLIVVGAIGVFVGEFSSDGKLENYGVVKGMELAVFQSVVCRTAGFSALGDMGELQPGSMFSTIGLMFIGGAPASMGGGITTGTLVVLVLALVAYVRRRSTPVVWGRAIPGEMVRKAAAILTLSLFAVTISSWMIMIANPQCTMDQVLFEVCSAFATCGLSVGQVSEFDTFGQCVLMFMMCWGRLGALTILFAFTRPTGARRLNYPEEKILIG